MNLFFHKGFYRKTERKNNNAMAKNTLCVIFFSRKLQY